MGFPGMPGPMGWKGMKEDEIGSFQDWLYRAIGHRDPIIQDILGCWAIEHFKLKDLSPDDCIQDRDDHRPYELGPYADPNFRPVETPIYSWRQEKPTDLEG